MRYGKLVTPASSLALAVFLAAALAPFSVAGEVETVARSPKTPTKVDCVFTHPDFSGKCTQTVEVEEGSTATDACTTVLDCLNDIQCIKTYCSATSIRGGWKLEKAGSGSEPAP